jgi:hypothetical protein
MMLPPFKPESRRRGGPGEADTMRQGGLTRLVASRLRW